MADEGQATIAECSARICPLVAKWAGISLLKRGEEQAFPAHRPNLPETPARRCALQTVSDMAAIGHRAGMQTSGAD